MKGALDDLIAEAKGNYTLLQSFLHVHAGDMKDLRDARVPDSRIESLYPFDMADYWQPVLDLVARIEKASPETYKALEHFDLDSLLNPLPEELGSGARENLGDWPSAAGNLRAMVHVCHSLAHYDPSLHTLGLESEVESENAWANALYYMQETSNLLFRALAAVYPFLIEAHADGGAG
jgi:hypothetical protein